MEPIKTYKRMSLLQWPMHPEGRSTTSHGEIHDKKEREARYSHFFMPVQIGGKHSHWLYHVDARERVKFENKIFRRMILI